MKNQNYIPSDFDQLKADQMEREGYPDMANVIRTKTALNGEVLSDEQHAQVLAEADEILADISKSNRNQSTVVTA